MSSPNKPTISLQGRRWTLRAQLLASHIGLAGISMVAFGGLLFAMSLHATYRRAEADLLAVAQDLVQDLKNESSPTELTISDLYRHRFGMAPRDHAYLALWDQQGNRLYATPRLPDHVQPSDESPPQTGPHPFYTRATGRNFDVIVATPQGGQLLIGRPLAKEWDALEWLVLRIVGMGIVCLVGGIVVANWLSRRLSEPLTQLTETAERMTSRHLHTRIEPVEGSLEVVRLGLVFNQMLAGLETAFEKQTRFVAEASHELRTPVTVVLSQVEHALFRDRSPDEYRQALTVCLRSTKRMKSLIDQLLFLARADAGKLTLRFVPTNLADVAAQAAELLRPLATAHTISLTTDLAPAQFHGDPDRLGQVVTNLITNAIRYNNPHGHVIVQTRTSDHEVILQVRDDGIGIPLADQPHLFDRFYRVDTARTQQDDTGTGLGLSLVQEIVTAHAGTIDIQSTLGAGTVITIRLPIDSKVVTGIPQTKRPL